VDKEGEGLGQPQLERRLLSVSEKMEGGREGGSGMSDLEFEVQGRKSRQRQRWIFLE
jgi:hypothetical protein